MPDQPYDRDAVLAEVEALTPKPRVHVPRGVPMIWDNDTATYRPTEPVPWGRPDQTVEIVLELQSGETINATLPACDAIAHAEALCPPIKDAEIVIDFCTHCPTCGGRLHCTCDATTKIWGVPGCPDCKGGGVLQETHDDTGGGVHEVHCPCTTTTHTPTPIQTAVAATLRFAAALAFHHHPPLADDLYDSARNVLAEDLTDSWSCPLCQEATCDTGCALEPHRNTTT